MNALRALSVDGQVALLFVALFGVLLLLSLALLVRTLRDDGEAREQLQELWRDLRALWLGALVFWVAWMSGPIGSTLSFGVFSFLALREFITLVHTRRGDHRSLLLAFFVALPFQYLLVGLRAFDLFTVFVPVYVFLAIPVVSALAGDPGRFLERNAKIQWGIMVCVFGLSRPSSSRPWGGFASRWRRSWPAAAYAAGPWCGRSTAASRSAPGGWVCWPRRRWGLRCSGSHPKTRCRPPPWALQQGVVARWATW